MSFGGGSDRSLMRPLTPEGNIHNPVPGTRIVGNLKGDHSGLNIANPRPGTVHQYARRNSQAVMAARQRGWWIADPERDGRPAYQLAGAPEGVDLTGPGGLFPDLVHMVTGEENFRRLQNEGLEESRRRVDPRADAFLDGMTAAEQAPGRRAGKNSPTRFAMAGHGTTIMEGNRVVEQLTPNGVVRAEEQ